MSVATAVPPAPALPALPAIAGLSRLSTCDWPGRIVATVFLQGCPWRCSYCHNPELLSPSTPGRVPWQDVLGLLARRRGLLDGVVFSGGEPTRQDGLPDAVREVRDLGFGAGLHTAGAYPRRLETLLPLLDWVGLDIKGLRAEYPAVTGVAASADRAFASLRLVLAAGVEHEVRITVDPCLHTDHGVRRLVEDLRGAGACRVVLQQVRPLDGRTGRVLPVLLSPPDGVAVRLWDRASG
ncbi:anaerobic ribonucleoside-triphosphate reductase activating protein [Propionicimonas sp.]|uniref:anaerobic ribonucleoside-triphosphate reductase activating protein n=1 Tax=Propionicimonas sp. TaxID=1955623 RepID=UPI0039E66B8F